MKKMIACLFVHLFFISFAFAQMYRGEVDSTLLPAESASHYQPEYALDAPVDANAWAKEKEGLNAAFGSEDKLYFRTEVPEIKSKTASWEATGWRGERLNTQIVVWSLDTLQQV